MESHYSDISKMQETINIKRGNDVTPITYIDSGQIAEIKKHGNKFHEFTMLEAIAKMDLPKGTFLDIGAHVGNHSIFFAKYCSSCAQVMAFEASPITFEIAAKNMAVYGNAFIANMAVGAESGRCKVNHNSERPGQSVVVSGNQVPMTTIDYVQFIYPPVIMKIDVEGGEIDVLKGAKETIAKHLPELFIEHHADPTDLLSHLPGKYKIIKRYNNAPTYHLSAR